MVDARHKVIVQGDGWVDAMKQYTDEEKAANNFFKAGAEYFIAAQFSCDIDVPLLHVAGILFHHAIEMLIKGYLVTTLQLFGLKKIGHNLEKLWAEVKTRNSSANLQRFDFIISKLNRFENIRYPDKIVAEGIVIEIRRGPGRSLADALGVNAPRYDVDVEQLEELVSIIFAIASVDPGSYFKDTPEIRKYIPHTLLSSASHTE